jgi:FAD/FMN-containing dehydrogenase/Fe-S oxidoreductase
MDPDRSRIQSDLSGVLDGDIRCDDNVLQLYSSDASIYEIKPLGVVRPAGVEDVVACVNYARENDLAVIPRGAGSSVSGGAIGRGLVLDFSYAMRSVRSLGRDEVTIEPGVVVRRLNQQLAPHRQHFGPDPATRAVSTMGGVLSNNSTGSRWNRYGNPRDRVTRLQVVLASGNVVELNAGSNIRAMDPVRESSGQQTHEVDRLSYRLQQVLTQNADLISRNRPKSRINQAGYNVFDLQSGIGGQAIDLTRLIVGSEGTLGIITEATLKTDCLPAHRGVALLFFERIADAAEAALQIDQMQPAACDMVDRRLLSIARQKDVRYQKILPIEAESMLLVEFQTADEKTLQEKLEDVVVEIQRRKNLAFDVRTTSDPDERDFFWHLVRRIVPIQYRLGGQRRAIPFVEDIAIAPTLIPDFLGDLYGILNRHEVTASVFAHMPQGHLHIRPLINMADPSELPRMQRLATELFDRVVELNGTISGGQGDGLSRTWYLRQQYGHLCDVFSQVKNTFDPHNVLNPGKVIDHPAHELTQNVREVTVAESLYRNRSESGHLNSQADEFDDADSNGRNKSRKIRKPASLPVLEPQLAWDLEDIAAASQACNGCARCRTRSPVERMCPMFRAVPTEEASPRAKANLIRGVVTGQLDPRSMSSDAFRSVADLCVNCHQCRLDCPASVDVPKLMVEAKAQHFSVNGLRFSDWCLTRLDWLYGVAGRMPRITNRLLRNRVARWLLDRLMGIAAGRKLPSFSTLSFARWVHRKKLDRPTEGTGDKVVYFVDAYANWNDVELAQAFVAVLQHNNVEVVVPPDQLVSGMSLISDGAIRRARKIAQKNVESLAEWIRRGYRVVTTEPSAALALSHEYVNLLDDEDAKLVASKTIDATNFLLELYESKKLSTTFSRIDATIGYHLPCHQRALGANVPALTLLKLIPGLDVRMINRGCSGMAGTYGLKRKNYVASLRMGFSLIDAMREPVLMAGTTECSTCKIQMEQGTKTPTVHPIKFLALAYGLMPELEDLFERKSEELVTT